MTTNAPTPVRGWAALERHAPLVPFRFERRALRPRDVALDVLFCGICHTDLHSVGAWGQEFPLVPGHEMVAASRPSVRRRPSSGRATSSP
jgi:uncharacterized zinc-type alcohol dehydrogenase-like protein